MRFMINDRFINGVVAFESYGTKAKMSYLSKPGVPIVTLGTSYIVDNQEWVVVGTRKSDFNKQVINVDLELVQPVEY